MKITDAELAQKVAGGGEPLRDLCRQEVENFDRHLRQYGSEYRDGLARFERLVLEGYLYQKLRGHLDQDGSPDLPSGRQDGQA
jgi:hypothetical protein